MTIADGRSAEMSPSTFRCSQRIHNSDVSVVDDSYRTARRVVVIGIGVSSVLACGNIVVGLLTRSTSVVATGFEFAGDVLASSIVLVGMRVAARPAYENHPYGHGRFETLAAFVVGAILALAGVMIFHQSPPAIGAEHGPPGRSPPLGRLAASNF